MMRDPAWQEGMAPRSDDPACKLVRILASASGSLNHRHHLERDAAIADAIIDHDEADKPDNGIQFD